MKIFGMILIFITCLAVGFYLNNRFYRRVSLNCLIKNWLFEVEALVRHSELPLNKIIEKTSKNPNYSSLIFLKDCNNFSSRGIAFNKALRTSLNTFKNNAPLKNDEIELISNLCHSLTLTDLQSGLKLIDNAKIFFEQRETDAKTEYHKNGKLSLSLSVIAGLFAIIIGF